MLNKLFKSTLLSLALLLVISPCFAEHKSYQQQDLIFAATDQKTIKQRKEFYRSLPKDEQKKIKKARKEYEVLSEKEKQKLRKRWEKKSDSEKKRSKK